jgi:hypothetical protein
MSSILTPRVSSTYRLTLVTLLISGGKAVFVGQPRRLEGEERVERRVGVGGGGGGAGLAGALRLVVMEEPRRFGVAL